MSGLDQTEVQAAGQSVGHSGIDQEHRVLVESLGRLISAIDGDQHDVLRLAAEFIALFERHSVHEENVMRQFQYPQIERHAEHHGFFIGALRMVLSEDPHIDVIRVNLPFIRSAVLDHIARDDRDFGSHLRAIGCYGMV